MTRALVKALEAMPRADVEQLAWGTSGNGSTGSVLVRHLAQLWLLFLDYPRDASIRAAYAEASSEAMAAGDADYLDLGIPAEREPGEEG